MQAEWFVGITSVYQARGRGFESRFNICYLFFYISSINWYQSVLGSIFIFGNFKSLVIYFHTTLNTNIGIFQAFYKKYRYLPAGADLSQNRHGPEISEYKISNPSFNPCYFDLYFRPFRLTNRFISGVFACT